MTRRVPQRLQLSIPPLKESLTKSVHLERGKETLRVSTQREKEKRQRRRETQLKQQYMEGKLL